MKFLPLFLLTVALSSCAHVAVHSPSGPALFTGRVLEVVPRLVLQNMDWEFSLLVETDDGRQVLVYAGEENPGVHTGDRIRVAGQWLPDAVVEASEIVELAREGPGV
jgi:hypothetical protein